MTSRRLFLAASLSWAAARALAQPPAELKIIVPVEPGGGIDTMARILAHYWTTELNVPAVVLNRTGASGNIGTASVARARPDGQTLLLTGVSHLSSPVLHGNAGYEPLADFAAVTRLATTPTVMLVGDALKGMTLAQVLEDPRSHSGGLSFGSAGYGHSSHLAAEVFMASSGAKWLHVPYRGNAPALRALMAGEVHVLFLSATSVAAAVETGRAHAIAVSHRNRLQALPNTPTLSQLGVRDADFTQWYGLLAPRGTPPGTLRDLSALALKAVQSPAVAAQLKSHSVEVDPMNHEQFEQFLAAEYRRLETLVKRQPVERPRQ